jgi:hypothetical protein
LLFTTEFIDYSSKPKEVQISNGGRCRRRSREWPIAVGQLVQHAARAVSAFALISAAAAIDAGCATSVGLTVVTTLGDDTPFFIRHNKRSTARRAIISR